MNDKLAEFNEMFNKFQFIYSNKEWQEIYKKLIKEKIYETNISLKNNNLVDFLNWCINLFLAIQRYKYFKWKENIDINPFEIMFNNIKYDWWDLTKEFLVKDLIELAFNYIIIPNECINKIIKNYNILLITL